MWRTINHWSGKQTKMGKEILIKSYAQAIPTYCMSVFLLPSTSKDELQKMMNSFWWGSKNNSRGIHWMSWDKLFVKKEFGKMIFKNLHAFYLSMSGKQDWRFIAHPNGY